MPRTLGQIALALIVAGAMWTTIAASSTPVAEGTGLGTAIAGTPIHSVYIRAPRRSANTKRPMQVLLALHGMGGSGEEFSKDLFDQADKYGWLIVAPTIQYGDWKNPNVVAREDPTLIRALSDYLDQLPQQTGLPVRRRVLILGHSRGAQLAHRFAEFRPDRVLAVAALSAGTYTLPQSSGQQGSLAFPFGVKDLAHYTGQTFDAISFENVQFWVGVGGQDTNAADLPRQWDTVEGTTRVQRAQAFEAAMQKLGADSVLRVFTDARHDVTPEMRQAACRFLGEAMEPRVPFTKVLGVTPLVL
jgi:pimeloyl-ACP methyl ester carboxylesterase